MDTEISLPEPFTHLNCWSRFALSSEDARMRARLSADMRELTDFYRTMLPEMEKAANYLDQWPLTELPASAKPLLYLTLMFMEAAMSVEFFKEPDVPEALGAEHMAVYAGQSERLVQ